MKKLIIFLLVVIVVLTSCSNNLEETSELQNESSDVDLHSEADSFMEELNGILNNSLEFIDFGSNKKTLLQNLSALNDDYMGTPERYAYADLDSDGENEILVEFSPSGDTAIIHKEKGNWVAYYRSFRSIQGLKSDGSSGFSSSAFESGILQLAFSSNGLIDQTILFGDTRDENHPIYTYNGKLISKKEYTDLLSEHFEKEDIIWHNIG